MSQMDSPETVEGYLIRGEASYDALGDGMWIVHDDFDHIDNIVVQHVPPLVVFRVKLMTVPADAMTAGALYRKLLELNGQEMVAGAYGLEGDSVVVTETLQSENLDYNEFQAALDGLTLAITEHYDVLKGFLDEPATPDAEG